QKLRTCHLRLEYGADDRLPASQGSARRRDAEEHALHHDHGRIQDGKRDRREKSGRKQLHRKALQRGNAESKDYLGSGRVLMSDAEEILRLRRQIASLHQDCQDLASFIMAARSEIAQIRPNDLKREKLPRAGKELDAIVEATEAAT